MPQNRPELARFAHVDENGELIFSVEGRTFAVTVDDTLERAILEAKQIVSETRIQQHPRQQSSLPISQIQALIRAGANPTRVAEKYNLSEALVRRFSSAVETEKQYAIEQFLTVPAPKGSKVRTTAELVERTLATASIDMESVTWKATRRGLEPWRIVAQFTSAGREIHAEWTWNMHDNSVMCVNNTARKLLGEQNLKADGTAMQDAGTAKLPGDSVRSARIERTVSAWSTIAQPSPTASFASADHHETSYTSTGSMPPISLPITGSTPAVKNTSNQDQPSASPTQSDAVASSSSNLNASNSAMQTPAATSSQQPDTTAGQTDKDGAKPHQSSKYVKRKSGRSAVPSWDEILFGD